MSEPQKTPGEDWEEEQRPYIPASPAKRIIAWTAVVYMVILVLLNVYPFFHQGENLYGVFPLMVCPGAVGLFILAVYRLRQGVSAGAKARHGRAGRGVCHPLCYGAFRRPARPDRGPGRRPPMREAISQGLAELG